MKPKNMLRQERERRGWSQARVAEQVGTDTATVSRWERGVSLPYPFFREKLSVLFGKSVSELGLIADDGSAVVAPEDVVATSTGAEIEPLYDPAMPLSVPRNFIGREALLSTLKQRLCSGNTLALTALNGMPGVGKTALALALATDPDVRNHFYDGVLWTGLGPTPNVEGLLGRWGTLLGVTSAEREKLKGLKDWMLLLRTLIGERRILLVIDDAWTIEAALAFKVGGPHCAYILTTRLPQLALSFADDAVTTVHELSEDDGVRLLSSFVPELVKREPETTRSLVRAVGGLPLALTLIGRHLFLEAHSGQPRRLASAVERLRLAERRLQLAQPASAAELPAHLPAGIPHSLQAAIMVSDQYLTPVDRTAFYALSVFPAKPNTFSEEAALAVCQAPVETLDRLNDAGLLESSTSGRYTLHQTIADYARLHLEEDNPLKRMSDYYIHFAEAGPKNYETLEMESVNIQTVLETAFERRWPHLLVRGCIACAPFLQARGLYTLAELHLRRAYETALALDDNESMVTLLLHQGNIAELQGDYTQAEACFLEGLERARQLDDRRHICAALATLGLVNRRLARYDVAEAVLQEGLALARQIGDDERMCLILKNLASIAGEQGNYTLESAYAQQGLTIARQLGLTDQVIALLINLGASLSDQGNDREAAAIYQEGIDLARQIGNRSQLCLLLTNLGWLTAKQEDYVGAEAYLQEGLALARQTGNREQMILLLINLGSTFGLQNKNEDALRCYEEGLELARQINHQRWMSLLLANLGEEANKRGNFDQARQYYQEGIALARQVASHRLLSDILIEWAETQLDQRDFEGMSETLREVEERTLGKEQDILARAQFLRARIAVTHGKFAEARRLGGESLGYFAEIDHPKAEEIRAFLAGLTSEEDSAD